MPPRTDVADVDIDIAPWRRRLDGWVLAWLDRLTRFAVVHWLMILNVLIGTFATLPFVAPVFMAMDWYGGASAIYWFYQFTCHQLPERSHFLFGFQMAYCARNSAIYATAFVAGCMYASVRHHLPTLDWRLYVLLVTPMALDGFTQLFGLRESTAELRTFTGILFGASSVWLFYPHIERFMADLQHQLRIGATRGR